MIILINRIIMVFLVSLLLLLTGCSTFSKKHAIPEEGLTMPELYHQAINDRDNGAGQTQANQDIIKALKQDNEAKPSYVGYTRTANNEINRLFKPLPNPSVPIYIYPHLTQLGDDMIPVPGYTSMFFLYRQNRYATTGEKY